MAGWKIPLFSGVFKWKIIYEWGIVHCSVPRLMTPDAFTYGTKSSMLRGCSITNHPAIGVPYSKLFDRVNKKQHTFHYMTALSSPCAESGLFDNPSIKTQPQKPVRNLGFVLDENFCFLDEGIHSNCSVGPSRLAVSLSIADAIAQGKGHC